MAIDRAAYDASVIDWERLRRYAQRVAKETRLPKDPPITYPERVSKSVTREVEVRGFLGLSRKMVPKTETLSVDEDREVVGPHWALNRRYWRREETTRYTVSATVEEIVERMTTALLPDGQLVLAVTTRTEVVHGGRLTVVADEGTTRELSDWDVTAMDFEKRYHEGRTGHVSWWGDRDPGPRLLRFAKGVGINLTLKAVLEGRRPV